MRVLDFTNKWVLVTGASSGLGYEMACQLAHYHKANLIIVARRADKLNQLKVELEQKAGVKVRVLVADLSSPDDVDRLIDECLKGQKLYCAILNAGVTYFGEHLDLAHDQFDTLIQINIKSVVRLTTELVRYFEGTEKEAGIMIVSSMAAMFPTPYQAIYSGTKSFVMSFVNALAFELKNKRLSLTVYAPGGIATEMTEGEEFSDLKKWLMPVDQAAKEGIYALKYRKLNHIPGTINRIGSKFMRLLPRKLIIKQLAKRYLRSLSKLK